MAWARVEVLRGETVIAEQTVELDPTPTRLALPGLGDWVLELVGDDRGVRMTLPRRARLVRRTRLVLDGATVVRITPSPAGCAFARGACPCCGGALHGREGALGGSYRDVVHAVRECAECTTWIVHVASAHPVLGRFATHAPGPLDLVTTPTCCPDCSAATLRTTISSASGSTDVEVCPRCKLMIVDPRDREILRASKPA